MPKIRSVEEFQEMWVKWWAAAQLGWRNTGSWPLSRDESPVQDWGQLSLGGKDGLFLVIISLAWWIHAQYLNTDSKLDDALDNVSWVMNRLITSLSINITGHNSSPSAALPSSNTRIANLVTSAPPRKRLHR